MSKTILHISDWHLIGDNELFQKLRSYRNVQQPDFLVITGDMIFNTQFWRGKQFEAEAQVQRIAWEEDLYPLFRKAFPKAHFVAVPGNHDYCDYEIPGEVTSIDDGARTFIVGGVKFTGWRGSPDYDTTPDWKWNRQIGDAEMEYLTDSLDPTADVLITHTPAYGIVCGLDHPIHYGSVPLRNYLEKSRVQHKAHLFGHAHENGGRVLRFGSTICSNAAVTANWIVIP